MLASIVGLWCWPVLLAGGTSQWRNAVSAKPRVIKNAFKHSDIQTLRYSDIQTFRHSDTQAFRHPDTREDTQQTQSAHRHSDNQTIRHSDIQTLRRCRASGADQW